MQSILQLVENKLVTMRTGEILKKKKIANTTFVEGGNGGREGGRATETPSMYQNTSEEGQVRCSAVGSGVTVQLEVS